MLLLLASLLPALARTSTSRFVAVAQPLLGESLIEIRDVLYNVDSFAAGTEVDLTCAPNAIRNIGEDVEEEVEDRNAASQFGLALKVGPVWNGSTVPDTLTATLDARRVHGKALVEQIGVPPDSLIEATVRCIRINAARSLIPVKFVCIEILGPKGSQRATRVYAVEPADGYESKPPPKTSHPRPGN